MIGFAIRHWKLLLDCIIVVAVIIAFSYWDPFKIFNTTKLRNTATLVTGVREIGELVTAEYYGEVMSSWKQFKLTRYPQDTIRDFAENVFVVMKTKLSVESLKTGSAEVMKFKNEIREPEEKDAYEKFIAFLGTKYLNKPLKKIYKNEILNPKMEARVLSKMHDEIQNYHDKLQKKLKKSNELEDLKEEFDYYLDSIPPFINEFYSFYSMLTEKDVQTGPNKKKNIVFIGRGWVKAGFRFDKFDESNFFYDRTGKVVHFYGLEPVILDKDINPWFIPQRNVKGFELVSTSGPVNFQDAKEVKKQCKELLLEQAGTEILKRAQENGAEALRSFFGLLLDEPDLQVEFHKIPYQDFYSQIASDTMVTVNEAILISNLYKNEFDRMNKITPKELRDRNYQFLVNLIGRLKKLHFINERFTFNYFSLSAARMLADTFHLSRKDFDALLKLRGVLRVADRDSVKLTTDIVENDSLWFLTDDFAADFNSTLDVLMKESISIEALQTDSIGSKRFSGSRGKWAYDTKPIVVWDSVYLPGEVKLLFFFTDELKTKGLYPPDYQYDISMVIDTLLLKRPPELSDTLSIYNPHLRKVRAGERNLALEVERKAKRRNTIVSPIEKFSQRIKELKSSFVLK
jgi:hypothetical protein